MKPTPIIYLLVLCLPLLYGSKMVLAQNLFSLDNSLKFADHLYADFKFAQAAAEYERVLFMQPENSYAMQRQIMAYGKAKNYRVCLQKLQRYNTDSLNPELAFLYGKSLLKTGSSAHAYTFAMQNKALNINDKTVLATTALAFNEQFAQAKYALDSMGLRNNPTLLQYSETLGGITSVKKKSAAMSMAMSAVIPGSGKIYSGYWKDGLVVLAFTSVSTWQAYRGFSKSGVKSVYAWVYAGSSFGFYVGNIYGARKAAFKYNTTKIHKTIHRIETLFNNY